MGCRYGLGVLGFAFVAWGGLGCESELAAALAEVRAAAPAVCKDYCESRVYCEWLDAPAMGDDEPEAHSDNVRRCQNDCAYFMAAGAWLVKPPSDPRFDREYVDTVSGEALGKVVTCFYKARLLRCLSNAAGASDTSTLDIPMPSDTYEGFGLFPATEEECELAAACMGSLGGATLVWNALGATCAPSAGVAVEAPFFETPSLKQ